MAHESVASRLGAPSIVAGIALTTFVASCSTPDDELSRPPTVTRVELRSGARLEGTSPAGLTIVRDTSYVLWFSVESPATWELRISLTRDQALSGAISLPVSAAAGTGVAAIRDLDGTKATAGSIAVTFGKGAIQGTADVQPDALAGSFWGKFELSCSVPRSSLGNLAPPSTSGGDVEPYVEDEALISEVCAPFKALKQ